MSCTYISPHYFLLLSVFIMGVSHLLGMLNVLRMRASSSNNALEVAFRYTALAPTREWSGEERNIAVHIPWLLVTGSVLLYAWRLRRKQVSCHASVQTKAEARSDGRKENEGKRRFLQKVVVITGAAGDIGNATASAFAREGASIVLVDLPQTLPQLKDQCKELQASGAYKTVVLCADMTREEEVQSMVAKTVERLGE